jgi:hypothetical protein
MLSVQVQIRLHLSDGFNTLRDMTEGNHIESFQLEKVKEVGAGAFATGAYLYFPSVSI